MKTQNLRNALELLSSTCTSESDMEGRRIVGTAQNELSKLQRLSEVVKGFIEDYGIRSRSELKTIDHDEALDLMVDICDIVGYHKE